MSALFEADWKGVFVPSVPVAELIVRGTLVYLGLLLLIRVSLKREAGTVGMADLLMVVLIADAAQNAMANDYRSIPDGLILVGTIVFWNFALDWLAFRFRFVQRFLRPPPLPLVENGRLLRRNMRRELVTEEELMAELRKQGIDDLGAVKEAYVEGYGHISAIRKGPEG
jgi:uncharacterized membrane protein YcaP (DUF421 family)